MSFRPPKIMAHVFLSQCLVVSLLICVRARKCTFRKPLDLGWNLQPDSIASALPFTPGVLLENLEIQKFKYRINHFCVGEHTSTHLDAPYHFAKTGWKVADIPLERLITNGVFMNFTKETNGNSSFRLEPEHIDKWMEDNGPLPQNAMVLISYGWAQLFSNRTAFTSTTSSNYADYRFPGMSERTVKLLATMKEIVAIGVDTPSVDPPETAIAHSTLLGKNIYFVETINLDQPCLPAKGFKVCSMPIKLRDGTGSPTRIIAVPESDG